MCFGDILSYSPVTFAQMYPQKPRMYYIKLDPQMPFAPFAFLVAIKANVFSLRRCLDTLAIGTARRRCRETTLALPFPPAQRVHDTPPHPRQPSASTVAIDGMLIAEIRGHPAPLAPRLVDIEMPLMTQRRSMGFRLGPPGRHVGGGRRRCSTSHCASRLSVG